MSTATSSGKLRRKSSHLLFYRYENAFYGLIMSTLAGKPATCRFYAETARRLNLDRRTVKSKVDPTLVC